jgi:hypothetical protein
VIISADALPFRPTRGLYATVHRILQPHAPATETLFQWFDQQAIPAAIQVDGVAGAWTFSSESTSIDRGFEAVPGSVTFSASAGEAGQVRVHLYFLDGDPLETSAEIQERFRQLEAAQQRELFDAQELLLASPLLTITPWQWDWFD